MKRVTLLLADDHPAVLEHLIDMLSQDFDIVAALGDGRTAYEAATALKPDAVVLDISMPVLTGLETAAQLARSAQPPCVVFLTVNQDRDFIEAAFRVGALGYVLKNRMASDLIPAIHEALGGADVRVCAAVGRGGGQNSGVMIRSTQRIDGGCHTPLSASGSGP